MVICVNHLTNGTMSLSILLGMGYNGHTDGAEETMLFFLCDCFMLKSVLVGLSVCEQIQLLW